MVVTRAKDFNLGVANGEFLIIMRELLYSTAEMVRVYSKRVAGVESRGKILLTLGWRAFCSGSEAEVVKMTL